MDKKTPLYDEHIALNAKMVPYAGYVLPIQYSSIQEEHMAVREKVGLFDVSHMGEFTLTGKDALANLNYLLSNDFTTLKIGKARYTTMLNEDGGIIEDLLVYRIDEEEYMLVVNAANIETDFKWIQQHTFGSIKLEDISDEVGQLALQGPNATEVLRKLTVEDQLPKAFFGFTKDVDLGGVTCLISRTGYTGSFGYEIYCKSIDTPKLWKKILEAGLDLGLLACGLGARDTLRIEGALPLYGQEMTEEITPFEAGLGFCVKMSKDDFIGKNGLLSKETPHRMRMGLKVIGRGIVRGGSDLIYGEEVVGVTTSGTHMPYLNGAYAMGLIQSRFKVGQKLFASVRGRLIEVEIVDLPFYK